MWHFAIVVMVTASSDAASLSTFFVLWAKKAAIIMRRLKITDKYSD